MSSSALSEDEVADLQTAVSREKAQLRALQQQLAVARLTPSCWWNQPMTATLDPATLKHRRRELEDVHDAFDLTGLGVVSSFDLIEAGLEMPAEPLEYDLGSFLDALMTATTQCGEDDFQLGVEILLEVVYHELS